MTVYKCGTCGGTWKASTGKGASQNANEKHNEGCPDSKFEFIRRSELMLTALGVSTKIRNQ